MEKKSFAQFLIQFLKGKWMMVAVSFYILSFSGATYIFGIYSGAIKSSLHYNQQTIDTLSFFKDLGANVGIVSGLLNEVTPAWFVLAVGAVMNLFGYLMIWLAVTHKISRPSVGQMYFYLCVGANSQTFANTGVLVTCVKNFPQSRGVVLGLVKGCVGLSGAIFTQVYHAIYGQDTRGVILLIGWLPSFVTLVFMFFIRPLKPMMDKRSDKHFFNLLYLALLLAGFLMVAIILENLLPLASVVYKLFGAITLLLVAANVLVAAKAEHELFKSGTPEPSTLRTIELEDVHKDNNEHGQHHGKLLQHHSSSVTPAEAVAKTEPETKHPTGEAESEDKNPAGEAKSEAKDDEPSDASKQVEVEKANKDASMNIKDLATKPTLRAKIRLYFKNWPERGEDFTIPQAVMSMDMWILFLSTTCGVGATLTAIDNMGQIGQSLGYSSKSISTCVSLISIWNFLGRVIAGFLSEYLLKKYRFPRTLGLTIVLGLACIGHLLIAFPASGTLYIASVMVGLCFGAQWPLLFAVISELFGLKYYATLYNVGGIASPLGSYLLNVRVAGYLYDKEARKQQLALYGVLGSDSTCTGPECFRLTFIIMTIVSAFGSIISSFLVMRTRKFYAQDIYAKFQPATLEDHHHEKTINSMDTKGHA